MVEPKKGLVKVNHLYSPIKQTSQNKADSLRAEVAGNRPTVALPDMDNMPITDSPRLNGTELIARYNLITPPSSNNK